MGNTMKKNKPLLRFPLLIATSILLAACVTSRPESATLYDLGPLQPIQHQRPAETLPPISVTEISVPAWLDRPHMFFRLAYENEQQARFYAQNRWSAPPAQLLEQRLKSHITQSGGIALPSSAGATGVPVLHVEVTDFIQTFTSPQHSEGQVGLRASVFNGRTLVAQKTFIRQARASSADASGGAKALATASDAAISDLISWLDTLPLR